MREREKSLLCPAEEFLQERENAKGVKLLSHDWGEKVTSESCWGILARCISWGLFLIPLGLCCCLIHDLTQQLPDCFQCQQDPKDPKSLNGVSYLLTPLRPPGNLPGYWRSPPSQQLKNAKHSSARKMNPPIWKEQPFERAPGTLLWQMGSGQASAPQLLSLPGPGIWNLGFALYQAGPQTHFLDFYIFICTPSKGTSQISKPSFSIFQKFLLWFLPLEHLNIVLVLPDQALLFW